jgi:hypothetical protein
MYSMCTASDGTNTNYGTVCEAHYTAFNHYRLYMFKKFVTVSIIKVKYEHGCLG